MKSTLSSLRKILLRQILEREAAPKAPKEKQKEKSFKEEAKIEGAKQIAIGYKKEVDFAGWYIDVSWFR